MPGRLDLRGTGRVICVRFLLFDALPRALKTASFYDGLSFWITKLGACWLVCFLWMYRLGKTQNSLLDALQQQGRRIEALSREEHQLIQEVHPQVAEIKQEVTQMAHPDERPHVDRAGG
ncbi:MAG: hypothetical protein C0483_19755 [Pirellula sp.]|nr:hypothetical protein [Pirellula sp.]